MNINDIFTIEQYDEAYEYVSTHEYTSIEDLGDGQYKIIELHKPTQEELDQEEAKRILSLSLTGADVERGIYKAKGIDFDDIVLMVQEQAPEQVKPLRIELKANNFYRGNEYVNIVGNMLDFSSEQLDNFFIDGNSDNIDIKVNAWKHLLPLEPKGKEPQKDENIPNSEPVNKPDIPEEV